MVALLGVHPAYATETGIDGGWVVANGDVADPFADVDSRVERERAVLPADQFGDRVTSRASPNTLPLRGGVPTRSRSRLWMPISE